MRQLVGSRGRGAVLAFTLLMTGLTVAVQAPSAGPVSAEPVFLASYRERVLANNPVGYWGLNEQSGRRATDSGPNQIEADYRGPAGSFTLGEEPAVGTGSSVRLDGVDGFVYVADS